MATRRRWVLAAAVIGTFLASVDVTVVGTAMPTIIAKLGGLSLYPWVFSIFLLTSTVSVPLYGKGADLFGRKPVYLAAVILFVVASALCATAPSMEALILWRAVQGLGAGGVMPVTLTIIGDLYAPEERARIQGLFSSVWAISSVVGPALGAFIVGRWSWPWIFLVNLPFGALAALIMIVSLREEVPRREHRLDLTGATLLTVATTGLMWALLRGGEAGFTDQFVLTAFVASALLSTWFVTQERRHPEPMIPPALLRERIVLVTCASGLFLGVVLYGITSYVPAFIQGVLHGSPIDAGAAVIPLGVSWPLFSVVAGRMMKRFGQRATVIAGGVLLALGGAVFFQLDAASTRTELLIAIAILGAGLGFTATTMLIASQAAVEWNRRGSVTALVQFSRMIGGAIGVAAMGAVLNASLAPLIAGDPQLEHSANALMDPHLRAELSTEVLARITGGLSVGLSRALIGVGLATLMMFVIALLFPRPKPAS